VRWERDKEIQQLIDYLNEPKRNSWSLLTDKKDQKLVIKELERCRQSFFYCARNYFYISDRKKDTILLRLNDSQELVLDKMNILRQQGHAQKVLVLKARRLGVSTLAESMLLWAAMLFPNNHGLAITYDQKHAQKVIWKIPQFTMDRCPWWMVPRVKSRSLESGIEFDRPSSDTGNTVGANSSITVDWANKEASVGRGYTLNALHGSEVFLFRPHKMREIIEDEAGPAISNNIYSFGILESTPFGDRSAGHEFWRNQVALYENAEWLTIFIPYFFDRVNVLAPPGGWEIKKEEKEVFNAAKRDWVRCSHRPCRRYHERVYNGKELAVSTCKYCGAGTFEPIILTKEQIYFLENKRVNRSHSKESLRKLHQEYASNAEACWAASGDPIFSDEALLHASMTVDPSPLRGFLDQKGNFHGVANPNTGECFFRDCTVNHKYDEKTLLIYDPPREGSEYVIAGDPSEGIGQDNMVACVMRKGEVDKQVAVFCSNEVTTIDFAHVLNHLGHWYNDAQVAVEIDKGDHVAVYLRTNLQYPNLYFRKGQTGRQLSLQGLGWKTNVGSKPRLFNTMRSWMDAELVEIRDSETLNELKSMRKEDETSTASPKAAKGKKDDRAMAVMIALYVIHEDDYDETYGAIPIRNRDTMGDSEWIMVCKRCGNEESVVNPMVARRCGKCSCYVVDVRKKVEPDNNMVTIVDDSDGVQLYDIGRIPQEGVSTPDYESL
jgi:hypothetical protein